MPHQHTFSVGEKVVTTGWLHLGECKVKSYAYPDKVWVEYPDGLGFYCFESDLRRIS